MLDQTVSDQIDYLEQNIAEVQARRTLIGYKTSPSAYDRAEETKLRVQWQRMRSELHELRPYSVCENGSKFCVALKGMFVCDSEGEFLFFDTADIAQAWIASQPMPEAA